MPRPQYQDHNDREAAWARSQPPALIRQQMTIAHDRLVRFLATITDAKDAGNAQYFYDIAATANTLLNWWHSPISRKDPPYGGSFGVCCRSALA